MKSIYSLIFFIPVIAAAAEELPPNRGSQTETLGYFISTPGGGIEGRGVRIGKYWVERSDGKCDVTTVSLTDPRALEAPMPLKAEPATTSHTAVEECIIKTYRFSSNAPQ